MYKENYCEGRPSSWNKICLFVYCNRFSITSYGLGLQFSFSPFDYCCLVGFNKLKIIFVYPQYLLS